MTLNARPTGPTIRQQVFGAPKGQPTAPGGGDPFLAPFFETAIEHVWGGVWNRPGLELKYRSLVVVSVLAALGQLSPDGLRGLLEPCWVAARQNDVAGITLPLATPTIEKVLYSAVTILLYS